MFRQGGEPLAKTCKVVRGESGKVGKDQIMKGLGNLLRDLKLP